MQHSASPKKPNTTGMAFAINLANKSELTITVVHLSLSINLSIS